MVVKSLKIPNVRKGEGMKISPYFRWYDLWVGVYIDTKNKAVYIGVLMVGIKIQL